MVVDRRPLDARCGAGDHGVRRDADPRRLAAGGRAHRRDSFMFVQAPVPFLPLALALMLGVSLASPRHVRRLALLVFCGSIVLLAATFVIGVEIKGARRWISRAGPVEPAALGVRQAQPRGDLRLAAGAEPRRAADAGLLSSRRSLVGAVLALLVMQPDLGMSIVVAAVWAAQLFVVGPADCGSRASAWSAARRRWSAPISPSTTCAAASTASSIPPRATTTRSIPRSRRS